MSKEAKAQHSKAVNYYGRNGEALAQEAFEIFKAKSFSTMPSRGGIFEHLEDACLKFLSESAGINARLHDVSKAALYVAMDAITTSTISSGQARRYFTPITSADVRKIQEVVVGLLSPTRLNILRFKHIAIPQLLSNIRVFSDRDVITTNNGYVAGIAVLWRCSTQQSDVLCIKFMKASIHKEGISFNRVREVEMNNSNFEPNKNL